MINIETLSLFNIKNFRKLYNKNYRSCICNKDFFSIYDRLFFLLKYLLRRQVKLFKYNNKYIGYIWYDQSKSNNEFNSIYSIYFLKDFIDFIDDRTLNFVKCNTLKLEIVENNDIYNLMNKLGFFLYSKTSLMKLDVHNNHIETEDNIKFRHFIKNCDEKLRCDIQNEIFYDENRVPLNIDDIFEEENQDYYINDFSVFIYVNDKCVGYGQIILSDNLYTIVNFGIIEEYRYCGYGQLLLKYLIELCRINDIDQVYIQVEKNNYKAISLYNKIGFRECASYDTWYKYL